MRIDNIGAIAESWFDKLTMTNGGARSHIVTLSSSIVTLSSSIVTLSSSIVTLSFSIVTLSLSKGDSATAWCP